MLAYIKKINLYQNKKCYLWHFNPKWEMWYRGFCKGLPQQRIIPINALDLMPNFMK